MHTVKLIRNLIVSLVLVHQVAMPQINRAADVLSGVAAAIEHVNQGMR